MLDTSSRYRRASHLTSVFFVAMVVFFVMALYAAFTGVAMFSVQTTVARFVSTFALLVLTAQSAGMFWNYKRLAVQIQHIARYLESLLNDESSLTIENILPAIHEYDCLVSVMPPPPIHPLRNETFSVTAQPVGILSGAPRSRRMQAEQLPSLQKPVAKAQAPDIPHIPTPFEKHRGFVFFASLAFALLYAELGIFHTQARPVQATAPYIVAVVSIIAFLAYLASFTLPPRVYRAPKGDLPPQVLELLFQHWGAAAGIILLGALIVFGLYLYLVNLDLVAAYTLLKDMALYAATGCAFHGLLLYVRYATYLYLVHQEDRLKMIVATASIGVLLVILALYLFTLDSAYLGRLEAARDPQVGLLGLHIYGRGLLLAGMAFAAYAWHIRWIGDH